VLYSYNRKQLKLQNSETESPDLSRDLQTKTTNSDFIGEIMTLIVDVHFSTHFVERIAHWSSSCLAHLLALS